jgi:signal transduction histidine kinase
MVKTHDMPHDAPPAGVDAAQHATIEAAYHAEIGRLLRRRLQLTVFLYLLFVGVGVYAERASYPMRAHLITAIYLAEVLASGTALIAIRVSRLRDRPGLVGAVLASILSLLMVGYDASVGNVVERSAMAQVCLLTGLVVTLPWSWRAQLAVAVTALIGFAVAAPHLVVNDTLAFSVLAMLTGATTSVVGVRFLERYRHDAFLRAALLTEEAEVAAALAEIAETLNANLNAPDMLELVNRVAARALGCDWSATVVWDPARGSFRTHSVVGVSAELQTEAASLEFPRDSLPIVAALRPNQLIEIADANRQTLVPVDLQRRLGIASALYAPISREQEIIGVLVNGYAQRTGPFDTKQRRIALGIAHATAIAMHNARLISDLQAASQLKSEFVSTMSHELRTPLNVISGYTDLLVDGVFDPLTSSQRNTVLRVRRSALELLDLVNATLDLNRLEAGRDAVIAGPIDLVDLFAEIGRELEALVPESVALRWRSDKAAALVESDRVKLKTILKNVVGNALKFTERGVVEVSASKFNERLVLEVRDTGVGIAAADLPKIFEMFRQADGSDSRPFGGVGLGLHIVQRLVDLLGGTVAVASAPGTGSTFTVRVPVGEVAREAPSRHPVSATQGARHATG